jgi:hypothetical protein
MLNMKLFSITALLMTGAQAGGSPSFFPADAAMKP